MVSDSTDGPARDIPLRWNLQRDARRGRSKSACGSPRVAPSTWRPWRSCGSPRVGETNPPGYAALSISGRATRNLPVAFGSLLEPLKGPMGLREGGRDRFLPSKVGEKDSPGYAALSPNQPPHGRSRQCHTETLSEIQPLIRPVHSPPSAHPLTT
jgi:hypothetical protein